MDLLFPSDRIALRRRDRILAILFAGLLVFLVARAARKDGGVLVRNQEFGARFLAGEDPYFDPARDRAIHGPYPPSFALIAAPLSLLSTRAARIAWSSAQALALLAAWIVLRRWARLWWPEVAVHAPVFFAGALLLASRFLLRDAAGGGGNLLFGTLALVGLDLALRGREISGGFALALSLVLKPNLLLLALGLAALRKWKALAGTTVAAAVLFVLPGISFGWERYAELTRRWVRDVAAYARLDDLHRAESVPDGMPPAEFAMNQSLREAVHRLLRPPGDTGAADVHVLETSASAASWIARGLSIVLVLATFLAARRAAYAGRQTAATAGLAFLPLCLLASPITWKAHHVVLLPLFFVLCTIALAQRSRPLTLFLVAYWAVCDLASEDVLGSKMRDHLQALSVVTWGCVALLLTSIGLVLRDGTAPRPG